MTPPDFTDALWIYVFLANNPAALIVSVGFTLLIVGHKN